MGFSGGSVVNNSSAMQETQKKWVRSLGWEDPLEEEMATYSSILAWRSPWIKELGELQSTGSQRIGHNWRDWACTHCFAYHPRFLGSYFLLVNSSKKERKKERKDTWNSSSLFLHCGQSNQPLVYFSSMTQMNLFMYTYTQHLNGRVLRA